ncbi:hypothetical protein GBAR_LOCUS22422, partial [Geodia barretti]
MTVLRSRLFLASFKFPVLGNAVRVYGADLLCTKHVMYSVYSG